MVVPDDKYKEDVDFTALALQHAGFASKLKKNGQLDFSDPESVRQLTKALLERDFKLTIELPEDRLCPPVPNRFNYIVFVEKLINSTRPDYQDETPSDERILGLDIGTGASAIYPLLACRQRQNWFFLATEIDERSREWALKNVKANNLQNRIKVVPPDQDSDTILPSSQFSQFEDYAIKIQLTNPPFYSSTQEMNESSTLKARPANSACTGAPIEMITPGGETKFITRLIHESARAPNRTKIQWFSSMLGKLSSVSTVIDVLKQAHCTNYVVSEFVQGQKTRRWCVAWTWTSLRPPMELARGITNGALEKKFLPFPGGFEFEIEDSVATSGSEGVMKLVDEEICRLRIRWHRVGDGASGIGRCTEGDVWSRKARRQLLKRQTDCEMTDVDGHVEADTSGGDEDLDDAEYDDDLPLAFKVTVQQTTSQMLSTQQKHVTPNTPTIGVRVRWLQGHDPVLFESFCGWLKRRLNRAT